MRNLIIFFLVTFFSHTLFGQRAIINGYVKSLESGGAPIDEVYVMVKGSVIGAIPDSLGYYKIDNLSKGKKYNLVVIAFGYDEVQQTVELTDSVTIVNFEIDPKCKFNKELAESDIKKGKVKLLLIGSIAPIANSNADKRFERKYKLRYYDFGCTPPAMECIKQYNETIFEYLDSKYGTSWRKSVRKDVEFLK